MKEILLTVESYENWKRGLGFYWVEDDRGGYIEIKDGTCPYPLQRDWSIDACNRAGTCGCVHFQGFWPHF